MKLLLRWIASAVAVYAAVSLVEGISYDGRITTLFVVALVLGLVNALVRPILKSLACGLIVLTLGLFLFVINAAMLYLAAFLSGQLGYGFHIADFVSALIGSVIITLVSWVLSLLLKDDE